MRISDWSSDVCSSDLHRRLGVPPGISKLPFQPPPPHTRHQLDQPGPRLRMRSTRTRERCMRERFRSQQAVHRVRVAQRFQVRSEEHTSELQSLMRNSYAVFCLKKKKQTKAILHTP